MTRTDRWALVLVSSAMLVATGCSPPTQDAAAGTGASHHGLVQGSVCTEQVSTISTLGYPVLGHVITTNTDTHVVVTLQTDDPSSTLEFQEIFLFVGTGDIPRDSDGKPVLSQYTIAETYSPGVTQAQFTFAFSDLFGGADPVGQTVHVSAYVKAYHAWWNYTFYGWAYGEDYSGCGCYGVVYPYTICTEPTEETGCTRTLGYWKTHNQFATRRGLRRDWPAPMDENATLCQGETRTNLEILGIPSSGGDAYLILAKQLIAAQLNLASGASSTTQVDDAIADGLALIEHHCGEAVQASTEDGQLMVLLGGILDAYNNGYVGPGHCE